MIPVSRTGLDEGDDAEGQHAPAVFLELAILEHGSEVLSHGPELGLQLTQCIQSTASARIILHHLPTSRPSGLPSRCDCDRERDGT